MGPEALQVIHKMRDNEIIKAFQSLVPEFKQKLQPEQFVKLTTLSLSRYEAAWSLDDPEVVLPVIYSESIATKEEIVEPATSGQSVPLNRSLATWAVFQELLLKEKVHDRDEKAFRVIGQAIGRFRRNHTGLETQTFIERLWEHRWIYESKSCANWLLSAIAQSPLDIMKIVNDGSEAERVFRELELRLKRAKDSAATLDEWFEKIYLALPLARYGHLLYENTQKEDGKKRHRLLEEIIADIRTVFMRGMLMLVGAAPKELHYWAFRLPTRKLSLDETKKATRQLSYGYRARVKYPKFWFDEVCKQLKTGNEIPISIGRYDCQRLVSIFITDWPKIASHFVTGDWPSPADDFVMVF